MGPLAIASANVASNFLLSLIWTVLQMGANEEFQQQEKRRRRFEDELNRADAERSEKKSREEAGIGRDSRWLCVCCFET